MRPVVKDDGGERVYAHYRDALDDLANQIGLFCSYCEMPIKNAPEVEHVQPKTPNRDLLLEWSNFLLGCKSCNSIKSKKPVNINEVAFPDMDNTFRGLSYENDRVCAAQDLDPHENRLILAIVELVKLHRHPSGALRDDRPSSGDRRFKFRREAWAKATRMLQHYLDRPGDSVLRNTITHELAPETGYFSVWMTVFREHPIVLSGFIDAFRGTARDCFDENGTAVRRPEGRV